jgi:hypothetical protein
MGGMALSLIIVGVSRAETVQGGGLAAPGRVERNRCEGCHAGRGRVGGPRLKPWVTQKKRHSFGRAVSGITRRKDGWV